MKKVGITGHAGFIGKNLCEILTQCNDNTENGDETDEDCGGSTCNACSAGKKCDLATDCTTNYCDGDGICAVFSRYTEFKRCVCKYLYVWGWCGGRSRMYGCVGAVLSA